MAVGERFTGTVAWIVLAQWQIALPDKSDGI